MCSVLPVHCVGQFPVGMVREDNNIELIYVSPLAVAGVRAPIQTQVPSREVGVLVRLGGGWLLRKYFKLGKACGIKYSTGYRSVPALSHC